MGQNTSTEIIMLYRIIHQHLNHHLPHTGVIPVWRVSLWRLPVWRVSLWRGPSSARFTLARCQFGAFHFGAFPIFLPNCTEVFSTPVWHYLVLRLCWSSMRVWPVARVAYTFVGMFPFCEEVFYMRARISFLRIIPLCVVHHLFIKLVNVSSWLHHSGLVY